METLQIEFLIYKNYLTITTEAKNKEYVERLVSDIEDIMLHQESWKSKYNRFVVYDYAPFCLDGFKYEVTYSGEKNSIKFAKKIIENKIDKIIYLEKCLLKESESVK